VSVLEPTVTTLLKSVLPMPNSCPAVLERMEALPVREMSPRQLLAQRAAEVERATRDGDAALELESRAVADGGRGRAGAESGSVLQIERAGADGGGAGIRVGAAESQRAGAGLGEAAGVGAGDGGREGDVVAVGVDRDGAGAVREA
jgi:hypothetical protein